jgi:hypothetical protein
VVAERDRVREVLEAHPVLGETRNRQHPRRRAERDNQLLVGDLELACERLDDDGLALGVVAPDVAEHELGVRAHLP